MKQKNIEEKIKTRNNNITKDVKDRLDIEQANELVDLGAYEDDLSNNNKND